MTEQEFEKLLCEERKHFDDAVRHHRELWGWVVDEMERRREYVRKREYFQDSLNDVHNYCYLCQYVKDLCSKHDGLFVSCNTCPGIWLENNEYGTCTDDGSVYEEYLDNVGIIVAIENAIECAERVRDIPVDFGKVESELRLIYGFEEVKDEE